VVQDVSGLGYAGKRDRWNGYDASGHVSTFKRFEALEEQRKEERQRSIEQKLMKGEAEALEEDEARDTLGDATIGQKVHLPFVSSVAAEKWCAMSPDRSYNQVDMGGATRMSVRNLRIREDTAKFLFNLDPNSAHYDPKTRSLRSNPNPEKDPSQVRAFCSALTLQIVFSCGNFIISVIATRPDVVASITIIIFVSFSSHSCSFQVEFAGDNFVRYSGSSRFLFPPTMSLDPKHHKILSYSHR
jgi:hypothetical protein